MTTNATTQQAVDFLNGTGADHLGRTVTDYLAFDDAEWERCHNHVQWAFPSNEASLYNPHAPVVDMQELKAKLTIAGAINVGQLVESFTKFLGLEQSNGVWMIVDTDKFQWLEPHNHNFLRITRLLNLLSVINENDALGLLGVLLFIANVSDAIDKRTVVFWSRAAIGELSV